MTTETVETCDLCEAALEKARPVYVFNGFPLVECGCGLTLTNPRPPRQEIGQHYADGYYSYVPPDASSWKQRLKYFVLAELGGYPSEVSGVHHSLAGAVARLVGPHIMIIPPFVAGGRLLDAGCGAGEFLVLARDLGWQTVGLEIDPRGVDQARRLGLEVVSSGMEDCPLEDASFDTVVLNHTLEHCHDPNRVLAHCHRVLRKDGLLIAGVPNFACYDNRVFQDCWGHCEAPRHLYHFTPDTLSTILHRHGFALERLRFKKWFIPHSERINFRFLRRKLENVGRFERMKRMMSTRARVQVYEKLAKLTRIMSDADAASMMTAYARKR